MFKHLLILRYTLFNAAALTVAGYAYLEGWLTPFVEQDTTWLVRGIAAVTLVTLFETSWRAVQVGRDLDIVRTMGTIPARLTCDAQTLTVRLNERLAMSRHLAGSLVLLGLIGTVLGFIVALSGVDPSEAGDPASIAPMVSNLIEGMSIALHTTLAGAVGYIWMSFNLRILEGGNAKLFSALWS